MAIKPGARKFMNVTPSTSPLSFPIAKLNTIRNNRDDTKGEKIVCIQTFKNLNTSFL